MSSKTIKDQPVRSDYRFLKDLISKFGKDAVHIRSEYDHILKVFRKAGGSWKNVYRGNAQDISLLKSLVKVAYKTGKISRSGLKERVEQKGRG